MTKRKARKQIAGVADHKENDDCAMDDIHLNDLFVKKLFLFFVQMLTDIVCISGDEEHFTCVEISNLKIGKAGRLP